MTHLPEKPTTSGRRQSPARLDGATKAVQVHRLGRSDDAASVSDLVVAEQAVTILVENVGSFTLLCTPTEIEALAVGFLCSEGLIDSPDDIVSMVPSKEAPGAIAIRLGDLSRAGVPRNMIVVSSCGMCGSRNIEKMFRLIPPCGQALRVSHERLHVVEKKLRAVQEVFRATGGCHAAGIFDSGGQIVAFSEDIGRHSAVDKAVGKVLLAGKSPRGMGVVLSGRVSLEIVVKAARAGIELIVAVSAPSSLAVEAAAHWNITLCGFVRPGRANVYTHPGRISELREKGLAAKGAD